MPPPGATLSGRVWIDANANGVRDSCDPPGPGPEPYLQLREAGGQTFRTRAGRDGKFTFREVPRGEYELIVWQERGFQWPVTAPPRPGAPQGYALQLRGIETIEDLDFGIVGHDPLAIYGDGYGIFVVLFEDSDLDGELDTGECAVENPGGLAPYVDGLPAFTAIGELAVFKSEYLRGRPQEVTTGYPMHTEGPGIVASRLDDSGCPVPVVPEPVPGSRLFRAAIGTRPVQDTATLTVNIFADLNANGVDDDEPPGYLVATLLGHCEPGRRLGGAHVSPGVLVFSRVPAGPWRLQADLSQLYFPVPFEAVLTTPSTLDIVIKAGERLRASFGVHYPGAAFARIRVVRDDNRNGEADPAEPPVPGAVVCHHGGRFPDFSCPATTDWDGMATFGPVEPGQDEVWVSKRPGDAAGLPPPVRVPVTLTQDEVAYVTIPVSP